ncbi:MAG TPA: hypothetical protein VF773_07790 [Verrucomicrobiae bacterium]
MNAVELLESMHKKPALYWGGGEHPFTSWIAFTSGYAIGYDMAKADGAITPEELVPRDFHRFVTERFGETFPAGGRGWMSFIREHTSSEQEAFDLFFKLRAEYDTRAGGSAQPNG